ncbi:MAG: UDP-glucuronic acid decarboxylase family protein [Actinomycetes bacterium]
MRVVIAGGAGFLGSHLADAYAARGDEVVIVDDLSSGNTANIAQLIAAGHVFHEADVSQEVPVEGHVDLVFNMASPASPPFYLERPLETLAVGSEGTRRLLELAERSGARFVHASTSEVYGDPLVHPQPESYWGNVNPVGPRSVYDEAKRFAEALTVAYGQQRNVRVGLVRIFNTYGPRLDPGDGRVVSNFVRQALAGEPLTVYGTGEQTRSLCYVSDLVHGLMNMAASNERGPINLGNPDERTMLELAAEVLAVTGSSSEIVFQPLPTDDPTRRCPDITLAMKLLDWKPTVSLRDGLTNLVEYFSTQSLSKE